VNEERATLEREAIALAARGQLTHAEMRRAPVAAFTSEARLFAWTCAEHVVRLFGEWVTFAHVRTARVVAPRLALPLDAWAQLNRETDDEIDRAEALPVNEDAFVLLLDIDE
jgi:hypothetical protein